MDYRLPPLPMSTEEGTKIIVNDWKASGILDAVRGGSAELSPIDPFQDISPLPSIPDQRDTNLQMPDSDVLDDFINEPADDDEDEQEENGFERNAFDFIIDDEL